MHLATLSLTSAPKVCVPTSRRPVASRASIGRVAAGPGTADKSAEQSSRRRSLGLLLLLPALVSVKPSHAEDVQTAKGAAAERKAELKQTAQEIKSTGKDLNVFPESGFSSNESTTRGGKSGGPGPKPRQEDSIQPSPFSSPQ